MGEKLKAENVIGKNALVTSAIGGEAWHENYIGETGLIIDINEVDDGVQMFKIHFDNRKKGDEILQDESFFLEDLIFIG